MVLPLSQPLPAILVISPAWVGDMVMAQSLFKIIKQKQPAIHIDVLATHWSEGLFRRMPEVRHHIAHSLKHGQLVWKARQQLGYQLRQFHYQQAIVLPNSWKSALIPFWAQIPQRTGYLGEMRYGLLNDVRPLNKLVLQQTVTQFTALGLSLTDPKWGQWAPYPQLSPGQVDYVLQRLQLKRPAQPLLVLCPGAEYGSAKRWPLEYYAVVAKRQIAQGWQVWIMGSPQEGSIGARIQALSGDKCINLCGQTSLAEAIDLLSLAQAVVTNDSGLMHIAAALDKPLVAIYGSSSPGKTPPLSSKAQVLYLGLRCSPCFQRHCPKKHLQCLRNIKPELVLYKLNNLNNFTW
jgi:heptosyltransferase-2